MYPFLLEKIPFSFLISDILKKTRLSYRDI